MQQNLVGALVPPDLYERLKWKTILLKHKVPHPYSGADDSAPSLTGFGMTSVQTLCRTKHFKGTALLRVADGPRVKQRALFESQAVVDFHGAHVVTADGEK